MLASARAKRDVIIDGGGTDMTHRQTFGYEHEIHDGSDTLIYRLTGKFYGSPPCYEFLETVRDEIRAGYRRIVISLSGLEKINSTGIGLLAACYTSLKNVDGTLVLVGASDRFQAMLEVVCLWDMVEHHENENDALA